MKIKRNENHQPILKCLKCGKETAILTYEENSLYRISCECNYTFRFTHKSEAGAVESCNNLLALQKYNDLNGERIDWDFHQKLTVEDKELEKALEILIKKKFKPEYYEYIYHLDAYNR